MIFKTGRVKILTANINRTNDTESSILINTKIKLAVHYIAAGILLTEEQDNQSEKYKMSGNFV